jgi:hypothetical protein
VTTLELDAPRSPAPIHASEPTIQITLMDAHQRRTYGVHQIPLKQRRPKIAVDGRTYVCVSGSNDTGYLYRQETQ